MYSVVAMFCGPHDENNDVPRRRIDKAVQVSLLHQIPLLVAGDANHCKDIDVFMAIAKSQGVRHVVGLYDPAASTFSDAFCVARELKNQSEFQNVSRIYLVTDFWHMLRASLILEKVCLEHTLQIEIIHIPVTNGPLPPQIVLDGEQQGIQDFLAGRYGSRKAYDPYGKPCLKSTEKQTPL